MKKTKLFKLAVFIFAFIVGVCSVFADTLTYTVSTPSGAHAIKQGTCSGTCSGYGSSTLDFFCLQGGSVVQGIAGATASEMEISEDNFIIAKVLNDLGINEGTEGLISSSNYSLYSQAEEALYTRATSDEAQKWYRLYTNYHTAFNPTINGTLNFSLNGSNYVATATIEGIVDDANDAADDNDVTISCNSSIGTVNVNKKQVSVSVPKASITEDTTITLTCNTSYEYYMSQRFDGQSGTQDLAIKPKKYSGNKSLNASGQIPVEKKSKVTISKTDATGQKELPGAKLSILDKDGKVLNKCVFDKTNHKITYSDGSDAKACTWTSEETSYIMEGLPVGKYYLVEEIAPAGYEKSTEKIEIEITEAGAVKDKVVMKNSPKKVPVPDTLSTRSAILLTISMIDVALGIGLLLYIKKNKILN